MLDILKTKVSNITISVLILFKHCLIHLCIQSTFFHYQLLQIDRV